MEVRRSAEGCVPSRPQVRPEGNTLRCCRHTQVTACKISFLRFLQSSLVLPPKLHLVIGRSGRTLYFHSCQACKAPRVVHGD